MTVVIYYRHSDLLPVALLVWLGPLGCFCAITAVCRRDFRNNARIIANDSSLHRLAFLKGPLNGGGFQTGGVSRSGLVLPFFHRPCYLGGSASLFGITWKVSVAIFVVRAFGSSVEQGKWSEKSHATAQQSNCSL